MPFQKQLTIFEKRFFVLIVALVVSENSSDFYLEAASVWLQNVYLRATARKACKKRSAAIWAGSSFSHHLHCQCRK